MKTITFEVPNELIKRLEKMDDEALAARCEEEVGKRVHFLELLIKGWKTYSQVKVEHRRVLFLMLVMDNKDPLNDYERDILYPAIVEREQAEFLNKAQITTKLRESTASTVQLGADSLESSTGEDSGSQSPTDDYQQLPGGNFERVGAPSILIEDYDAEYSKKTESSKVEKSVDRAEKSNQFACDDGQYKIQLVENPNSSKTDDQNDGIGSSVDNTVVGVKGNSMLSESIALAAIEVEKALNNVEMMQSDNSNDMKNKVTKEKLLKLKSTLIQSASEVSQEENKNIQNLSKGTKKRMKKAAKKAAEAAESERILFEEEQNRIRQATVAAQVLKSLENKAALENVKPSTNIDMPISEEELQIYLEITKSQRPYEPNSREAQIVEKVEANKECIERRVRQKFDLEAELNAKMMKQIKELTQEISGAPIEELLKKEDEIPCALRYITKKIEFWKNSDNPQAPHYVKMYEYFLENCSAKIASLITNYMPYEKTESVNFEATMLLQYIAGNFDTDNSANVTA